MEALLAGMAPIVPQMKEKLREEGMWPLLTTLEMPLSRILFKMEQEASTSAKTCSMRSEKSPMRA